MSSLAQTLFSLGDIGAAREMQAQVLRYRRS